MVENDSIDSRNGEGAAGAQAAERGAEAASAGMSGESMRIVADNAVSRPSERSRGRIRSGPVVAQGLCERELVPPRAEGTPTEAFPAFARMDSGDERPLLCHGYV